MQSAKDISPEAFGRLFMKYRDKYISIACSFVRDRQVAEDIVAESFTAFWDNRGRIELSSLPEAYILQTIKNNCLNYLRDTATRLRIHQQIHTDAYRALLLEIELLSEEDLSFLFEADVVKIFRDFLLTMPEMTRKIFCSSRFEGLTYNEIAEKYNVTPRKVKRDISSVLTRMRDELKDYLP